ncbi:MAG TPA: hypothetical protein VFW44_05020 [Bryobacteraceae bacterium]|nr:hypothetical protein [Bryobacteraceae bacterium]
MKISYWLVLAAIGAVTCAQADTVDPEPGHYQITLTDWDNNQLFNATPNPEGVNPNDFSPDFCDGFLSCDDPSVKINKGGGSTSEDGPFTFSSGPNAAGNTVVLNFSNAGPPITELLLTVTLNPDQTGSLFTCDGGDVFQHCGFMMDDLEILFYDPYDTNGIPTATTPEPSQWIILLAFAAVIVIARKRSANWSFAGTQR